MGEQAYKYFTVTQRKQLQSLINKMNRRNEKIGEM